MQHVQIPVDDDKDRHVYTSYLPRPSIYPVALNLRSIVATPRYYFSFNFSYQFSSPPERQTLPKITGLSRKINLKEIAEHLSATAFPHSVYSNLRDPPKIVYNPSLNLITLSLPRNANLICNYPPLLQLLGLDIHQQPIRQQQQHQTFPSSPPQQQQQPGGGKKRPASPSSSGTEATVKERKVADSGDQQQSGEIDRSERELMNKTTEMVVLEAFARPEMETSSFPDDIVFGVRMEGTMKFTFNQNDCFSPEKSKWEDISLMLEREISLLAERTELTFVPAISVREEGMSVQFPAMGQDFSAMECSLEISGPAAQLVTGNNKMSFGGKAGKTYVLTPSDKLDRDLSNPVPDLLERKRPLTVYAHGIRLGMDSPNCAIAHIDKSGTVHFVNNIISDRHQSFLITLKDYNGEQVIVNNCNINMHFICNYQQQQY